MTFNFFIHCLGLFRKLVLFMSFPLIWRRTRPVSETSCFENKLTRLICCRILKPIKNVVTYTDHLVLLRKWNLGGMVWTWIWVEEGGRNFVFTNIDQDEMGELLMFWKFSGWRTVKLAFHRYIHDMCLRSVRIQRDWTVFYLSSWLQNSVTKPHWTLRALFLLKTREEGTATTAIMQSRVTG